MEESAYLFEVIAGVLYFLVGAPLLRLARRTRNTAALLIGVTFAFWGFSYLIYNLPLVFGDERLFTPFFFGGRVTYDLGALTIAVFTWKVFRVKEAYARGLVLATFACLAIGLLGSVAVGDWEGVHPLSNPWFWVEWIGWNLPLVWVAVEGAIEYARARRRVALGLCKPIICNRFFLWSLTGLFLLSSNFALLPQYIEYEREAQFSAAMDALVGVSDFVTIGVIYLVFFPPLWYRRRFEARSPSADDLIGASSPGSR